MEVLWFAIPGLIGVTGFLAGLLRPRYHAAPMIASAVIGGMYVALIVSVSVWAGSCWECRVGHEDNRSFGFWMALSYGGFLATALIAVTWTGALVALVAQLLRGGQAHGPVRR
ncbi:MAG: hypothetical protein WBD55_10945 [Dehalococcoidia bacterium]